MKEQMIKDKALHLKTDRNRLKNIVLLAISAVIENFFQTLLGFVYTYFVFQISLVAVSAVGIINAVLGIYFPL